jgi:replication initiation protein RepC
MSKQVWGDACLAKGRELAAVALAVVSTEDSRNFTASAGRSSAAWWPKHGAGELRRDRTVWALRRA